MAHSPKVYDIVQCDLGNYEFAEVMPIADIHIGDPTLDEKLIAHVADWLNEYPNRYVLIAGDVFNAGLKDSVSSVYNETMCLQEAIDYFKDFVNKLGKEKILAVIRGNHDNRVVKSVGLDPVQVACELCGITYCGAEAYLSLMIGDWNYNRSTTDKRLPIKYLTFMTHGHGGGRTKGAKVNTMMQNKNVVIADLYVQGHTHQPSIIPDVVYVADLKQQSICEKDQLFVTTSSFIGRGSYAEDFGFAPLSHRFPVIRLGGHRKTIEAELKEF